MSTPFFSIIVPVYKVEKYLNQCVNSILEQTCDDYEIILVDDGSPDSCGAICDSLSVESELIKVIHKNNEGLSMARNDGLKLASGEYIIFLDSDDYWDDNDFLEIAKEKLSAKSHDHIDVLIFGTKKQYHDGRIKDIRIPNKTDNAVPNIQHLMKNNTFVVCGWDKIVSRTFLLDNDIYFVRGQKSEDFEWCIKLLLANAWVDVLDISPHVYRQDNASSITANITRKNLEDICNVISKYVPQVTNIPLMNFLAEEYVLWMIPSCCVETKEIEDLIQRMKKNIFLLTYDWYPYVRKVKKFKCIGFDNIRKLLGLLYRLKRKI